MTVNLLKLCVGIDSVEHLREVRKRKAPHQLADGTNCHIHVTRFMPKRAHEVLAGGSLYWVIKGFVLVRQTIIGLEMIKTDNGPKCMVQMEQELVLTEAQPRRPHQGWRYLEVSDAPKDLPAGARNTDLPPEISAQLRGLGLL